ncbi:MAG: ATP-binding protein [Gemmatimonadota bacterium]
MSVERSDRPTRTRLKRYGAAVLASTLIVALPYAAEPWLGEPVPMLPFIVPVVLAAWYGGLGPGLVTTAIGGLVTIYVFVAPTGAPRIGDRADLVRFSALLLAGCIVSLLSQSLHNAIAAARRSETESRALAAQLQKQALELERQAVLAIEANAAKVDFLARMSHELRTPLNSIGGYVELIGMGIHGPVSAAQHEALRRIRLSAAHLLGLINDILHFAKIEAGQIAYDIEVVPIAGQLGDLRELIEPQLLEKQLNYTYASCPGGVTVLADPDKVRQVLLNVLSNAIKFTPARGHVTVACEADDDVVRVRVRDTGIGIPADQLENVFAPFVQLRAGTGRPGGTGLGLAISRDLARGLGGDLEADSVHGGGSVFTLTLPRAR